MDPINLRSTPSTNVHFFQHSYDALITRSSAIAATVLSSLRERYSSFSQTSLYDGLYYVIARVSDRYVAWNATFFKATVDRPFIRENGILITGVLIFTLYKVVRFIWKKMNLERKQKLAVDQKINKILQQFKEGEGAAQNSQVACQIQLMHTTITNMATLLERLSQVEQESLKEIIECFQTIKQTWNTTIMDCWISEAAIRLMEKKWEDLGVSQAQEEDASFMSCTSIDAINDAISGVHKNIKALKEHIWELPVEAKEVTVHLILELQAIGLLWCTCMQPHLEKILIERQDLLRTDPCIMQ